MNQMNKKLNPMVVTISVLENINTGVIFKKYRTTKRKNKKVKVNMKWIWIVLWIVYTYIYCYNFSNLYE